MTEADAWIVVVNSANKNANCAEYRRYELFLDALFELKKAASFVPNQYAVDRLAKMFGIAPPPRLARKQNSPMASAGPN